LHALHQSRGQSAGAGLDAALLLHAVPRRAGAGQAAGRQLVPEKIGMLAALKRYWKIIRRPSAHYSLGFLTIGGFIGGIIFWGGFNTAMEATNTEAFCTGCHEMRDNVLAELKSTIHYTNRSGVRAMCSNCHVPHDWTDKMARKMQASKEVWGKIFRTIDTQEKFRDMRLELARHEWARFKANDSLECRNCHQYASMDFTRQSVRAQA